MNIIGVGIDAAFANMAFARCQIEVGQRGAQAITPLSLELAKTASEASKGVRVSSDKLRRAIELKNALALACEGAHVAFVEVPTGSQSAQAASALGIAIGVLASCPIPIVEVSPMEVKEAVAGKRVKKGATKAEIIEKAAELWPGANWMRAEHQARSKGKLLPAGRLLADNEHGADAMFAVLAGIATPQYQQVESILRHAIPSPPYVRLALGRRRVSLL